MKLFPGRNSRSSKIFVSTASSAADATYDGIPRMPAMFGRQGGPRQRPDGPGMYPTDVGRTLVTWVAARADAAALEQLLPPGFALADPLLIVEATTLSELPWLAGRGYEFLMVSTPVVYTSGDRTHRGRLELVTWEDCPDAITSGREELGFNKMYADTMTRHTGEDGKSIRYIAAWGGTTFFELNATLNRSVATLADWRKGPLMHYRVLPRTGVWAGQLEVEQVVAHSAGTSPTAVRSLRSATGHFRFIPATFEQLPTQLHIVNTLAALELGEVVDAGQARLAAWSDVSDARILTAHSPMQVHSPVGYTELHESEREQAES